ncbi:MAG: hypothetical protein ACFFAU_10185 [Candidatus Hodarchaeota archaeon]
MELPDIAVAILVILAVAMAIFSQNLKDVIGELLLFLIEIVLLIGIIGIAIYGQTISRT